jgi:hypothetical protein
MAAADPQLRIEMLEAALRTASRELHWANLTIQKRTPRLSCSRSGCVSSASAFSGRRAKR